MVEAETKNCETCNELQEKYTDLLAKYETIVKVCNIVMHDIRSPLRFLSDVAESLILEDLQRAEHEQRKHFNLLVETSRNLSLFGNNVLDWFINNRVEISSRPERVSITEILQETILIYAKAIKANNNELVLDFAEDEFVITNKEITSIILRNAIDNANKYTVNGVITIVFKKAGQTIFVSIIDNGKGFDAEMLKQNIHNNVTVSHNLGFRIIHDMARQVGLEYSISSEIGVGTNFTLMCPQA